MSHEVDDFSSVYYFGTRLVRDLVTSTDMQSANYSEPINEDFYELERRYSGGGVGIQQLYSLQKST